MDKIRAKAIFISDTHLGHPCTNSKLLLKFLKQIECEYLFIVGDGIDFWVRNKAWGPTENAIVQRILKLSRKGTKVIYLYGNHDERVGDLDGESFGDIHVCRDYVYEGAYVFHGDVLDFSVQSKMKWLAKLGSFAYNRLVVLNYLWKKVNPHASFSQRIKRSVKEAVSFIANFETLVCELAKEKQCLRVICGHIHSPADKRIGDVHYLNCGDWLEDSTYILHKDGEFVLKRYV
jgi:UDP-2,3-diacylglucosamine pyrophosphatase LpxH